MEELAGNKKKKVTDRRTGGLTDVFCPCSRHEPAFFIHVFTKRTITFTLVLTIFCGGVRARLCVCVCVLGVGVCVCVCVVGGGGGGGRAGEKGAKESPRFFL